MRFGSGGRTILRKAGVLVGSRTHHNFLDSANVAWTIAEDSTNDEIEISATATGLATSGHVHTAASVTYAGSTNLAADDVEEALDELDAEKAMNIIASTTLGSSAATITFSSIPGTFRHLILTVSGRTIDAGTNFAFVTAQINGDTGGNYDRQLIRGIGATLTGVEQLGGTSFGLGGFTPGGAGANIASSLEVMALNYADTTFQKAFVGRTAAKKGTASGDLRFEHNGLWWRSTAAITSIVLSCTDNASVGTSFATGTRAALYGVM